MFLRIHTTFVLTLLIVGCGSDGGADAAADTDSSSDSSVSDAASDTGSDAADTDGAVDDATVDSSPSDTGATDGASDAGCTDASCFCEATGGTWDVRSCGHYECGSPPPCAAIIPGCDCGTSRSFRAGVGCMDDPLCDCTDARCECENTGGTWDVSTCGHYVCGVRPSCEAIIPGCDCGASSSFRTRGGCQLDGACE